MNLGVPQDAAGITARCPLPLSAAKTEKTDFFHLQIIVFNRFVTSNLFKHKVSPVKYVDGSIYFVTPIPLLFLPFETPSAQGLLLML